MEDQYGIADLRQYINGKPYFPAVSQPPDLLSCHRGLAASQHPYDMLMFRSDNSATAAFTITPSPTTVGPPTISGGFEIGGGSGRGGGTARWPRQETLSLLEIRSRLDSKFKEANQKSPLWDEISRIMYEEYGYQRSGKKCREKFENLYKYYKKTKDGKAGRQDGKNYRFFRQLEALYGEPTNSSETPFNTAATSTTFQYTQPPTTTNNNNQQQPYNLSCPKLSDSLPNSSNYDTISSYCSDATDARDKKRRGKKSLKARIRESIDEQMKKLMEKQETWMQQMMTSMEHKEQERMMREEQWRKQDAARIDREHKLWATERAWIEARDISLMDALHKLAGDHNRRDGPWLQETRLRSSVGMDSDEVICDAEKMMSNYHVVKCNKKRRDQESDQGINLDHADQIRYFVGDSDYGRL